MMHLRVPSPEELAFMADTKALLAKHKDLSAIQILCVVSNLVGTIIAVQDQTAWTSSQIMDLVAFNIEVGNAAALEEIFRGAEGAGKQ